MGIKVPLKPIEITAPPPTEDYERVSWEELAKTTDMKYRLDTSIGTLFFRRIGTIRRERVNTQWARDHPEYIELVKETEILKDFLRKGYPLDAPHLKKLEDVNIALIPIEQRMYIECVVEPDGKGGWRQPLKSVEMLDALLSSLQPVELEAVYKILKDMISSRPITEESQALLMIAKEFNIPIAEGVTLENMTAEMGDALISTIIKNGENAQRAISKAQDG